jgi:type I pantothenate kinase
MADTLAAIRDGMEVEVPVYSHRHYDLLPGHTQCIRTPATVIVEGVNVLQPGPADEEAPSGHTARSMELDWSIYVDAAEGDIARWFVDRLLGLRHSGADHAGGFPGWFCSLGEDEARSVAEATWSGINAVNLSEHIAPTRPAASTILHKGADHRVSHVLLRLGDHAPPGSGPP